MVYQLNPITGFNNTPRAYSDGVTYLEEFQRLVVHVNGELEKVNSVVLSIPEMINDGVNLHDREVVERLNRIDDRITALESKVNDNFNYVMDRLNTAIYNIQNSTIEVSDPVVSALISEPSTASHLAVETIVIENV